LLVANVVAGLFAVSRDWVSAFSAGRDVADHIRSEGLATGPIVGHREVQVTTVAGYLQRPLYYPSLGREAYHIPWDAPRIHGGDDAEVFGQARAIARQTGNDVLVVVSRSGRRRPDRLFDAVKTADFNDSIVGSERFELFLLPASAVEMDVAP
jgi:hypothetical protein